MITVVLGFFKKFIMKYISSVVLEKLIIVGIGELVKRTDSKIDDEVFHIVFHKTKKGDCEFCEDEAGEKK